MLKMPGPYLSILIIGHKFCSMLSIRNKLTLHKELYNFMKIMYLFYQKENHNNKQEGPEGPGSLT